MNKRFYLLILLSLVVISSSVFGLVTDNLISYYWLDNNVNDYKGYGYNNSYSITGFTTGKIGNSASFTKDTAQHINVTTSMFNINNEYTVSAWYYDTGSSANTGWFFAKWDSTSSFGVRRSTSDVTVGNNAGGSQLYQAQGFAFPTNSWTMMTLRYNNTHVCIYYNATQKRCDADSGAVQSSSRPFLIGAYNSAGDSASFGGYIDEFKVWNRSLTDSEISIIYTTELSGNRITDISALNITTFVSQTPADLTILNIINEKVNVTYNVTVNNLTYNSVFLNYTVTNGQKFVNGSSYGSVYNRLNYTYNSTNNTFHFSIDGDHLLSGTYNYFIEDTEDYMHNLQTLTNNDILSTKILNVRNNTNFNFVEAYLNTTGNSNVYYCNESYTTGNPAVNTNCFLLTTFTGTGFNHTHNNSRHNIIPFPINSTSGKIGTVQVTNTSYILIKGNTNNAYVGYIDNITRNNQVQLSSNNGGTYTNFSGTTDMHIHQFSNDALSYSVFANNGTQINSSWRSDTLGTFNIAPTNVVFTQPNTTNQEINTRFFNITYTQAIPTEGVSISNYNISLLNNDTTYNRTLNITPSNLFYNWNVYDSNLPLGIYYIKVIATDSNGLTSTSTSESINITRNGYINVTAKTIAGATITSFSVNVTNATAGINANYSTTNGVILADIVKGYTYNVFIDATGYAYDSTNKTTPATYNNHTFNLYTTNSFNIRFYDEVTKALLSTYNISLEIISDVFANNYTTSNGTLYLDLLSPSTYTFRYKSLPTYPERTYIVDLANRQTINLSLYLVNTTTTITLNVKDQNDNILENAYIKVLRYDIVTNSYTVREIVKTNVEGNAYFSAILNTEFYKFIVEYPLGNEVLVTSPDYIRSTSLTLRVNLESNPLSDYYASINTYSILTFNNVTNNFNFYYNDASNTANQGCLYVYRTINFVNTLINSSCVSSSSGTILLGVTNTSGYTYTAQGTVFIGETEYLLKTLSKTFSTVQNGNNKNNFFFLTLLLTAILGLLFVWNITIALIVTPIPIFLMSLTEMIPVSRSVGITLMLISLTLAFVISKKA